MNITVAFANISHGMIYRGDLDGLDLFSSFSPSLYIEYFKKIKPDILCLAEAPLDTAEGQGEFLSRLKHETDLQHSAVYVNDKSWIVEGKYYGTTILSRFPFAKYEAFNIPNPKLEIDRPDGHWIMHDKGAQKAILDINGKQVTVYNLHYFPVHKFGKRITDPELAIARTGLANVLTPEENKPTIITGDFNNKYTEIEVAFPEVFETGIKRAVAFSRRAIEKYRPISEDDTQIDHILYSSNITLVTGRAEWNYSDHSNLIAEFEI